MRVIYLGMRGQFSIAPLEALLAAGHELCALVIPAAHKTSAAYTALRPAVQRQHTLLPITDPYLERTIMHIAWEHGIPAFEVARLSDPATLALLAGLRPEVGCVACFARRIPAVLLALPPAGFLNVHPALLPAYRGPAPLFWSFRDGQMSSGVTIHAMDEGLDTGDIIAQAALDLPDGISGPEADQLCATLGGRLLVEALEGLRSGRLTRRPQPEAGSSHPWPAPEDFMISTVWPARRAFNFMRGTAEWGRPYPVMAGGEQLMLTEAIEFAPDQLLPGPLVRLGTELLIQFAPGVLRAR